MRFHEHHYTIVKGGYPKIHDKLKSIIDIDKDIKGKVVMDAGACTGSFGIWAMRMGAEKVIINDERIDYIERAKDYAKIHADLYGFNYENIIFDNRKVDKNYEAPIEQVDTLIARRFIYELRDDDTRWNFIGDLKRKGLNAIYLQGLVPVKNHKERFWNVDLEAKEFETFGYLITNFNVRDLARMQLDDGII